MNVLTSLLLVASLSWHGLAGAGHAPIAGEQVLVVTSSGVAAYEEVLDGFRKALGPLPAYVVDLRLQDGQNRLTDALQAKTIRVLVTIGVEAAENVMPRRGSIPLVAAAITPNLLPKQAVGRGRMITIIPVHVPFPVLLDSIKRVFPRKLRLGMIYNPAVSEASPEALKAAADAAGFKATVAECAGPAQLLQVLQSFKDEVDLVLCFPDATLYNSATVKPLVLASLRYRLPLVGFSESFVRAGAALSIYSNFREIGVHSAELVQKALSGQPVSKTESPRKFKLAVNQNITRLLGLGYSQPPENGEDFLVIR